MNRGSIFQAHLTSGSMIVVIDHSSWHQFNFNSMIFQRLKSNDGNPFFEGLKLKSIMGDALWKHCYELVVNKVVWDGFILIFSLKLGINLIFAKTIKSKICWVWYFDLWIWNNLFHPKLFSLAGHSLSNSNIWEFSQLSFHNISLNFGYMPFSFSCEILRSRNYNSFNLINQEFSNRDF